MANSVITLVLRAKDEASKVLTSTTAKIGALITAIAGGLAINKALTDLSKLDHAATALNMSVEKLTASQYAFSDVAGVGADELVGTYDKMRVALGKLNATGAGRGSEFFEIMKVDIQDFMKLDPADQLLEFADAARSMDDNAKANFFKQFTGDSQKMMTALKDGSGAIREQMALAEKYKITISDFDARAVTRLGDIKSSLQAIGTATFNKMFASIAPELEVIGLLIRENLVGGLNSAEDASESLGKRFENFVVGSIKTIGFLTKSLAGVKLTLSMVGLGAVSLADLVLKGVSLMDRGFTSAFNSILKLSVDTSKMMFSAFDKLFLAPLIKALNFVPGMSGIAKGLTDLRSQAEGLLTTAGNFKLKPADTTESQKKLGELKDSLAEMAKTSVEVILNTDGKTGQLVDDYTKGVEENRKKIAAMTEQEARDRVESLNREQSKLLTSNREAAAKILEIRAKLQADLARMDIEQGMARIEAQKSIDLKGLDQRARAEKMTASQVAEARFEIEMSAARRLSAERKKLLDEDVKLLLTQIQAQKRLLGDEVDSGKRELISAGIVEIEAEITRKKREQLIIGAELVTQQAMLKAERAAELDILRDQLKTIREDAEIELRAIRGDKLGADLTRIEKDFADTIKEMEQLGEDSTAVKELISVKKAKAEIEQIEREYAALKKRLERGEIGGLEFLKRAGGLENRGQQQAGITGDDDDVERIRTLSEDAQSMVFDIKGSVDSLAASTATGLENIFMDFVTGSKSAKEAFSDFARSMLADITKMIAKLLMQMAIQQMINALSGGTSSIAQGASGFLGKMSAGLNHTGGLAGQTGISKTVNPLIFAGAMRYHTGGKIGLKPNEVPIIAEKSEEILTASDPRHRDNLSKGGSKQPEPKITINNVIDSQSIANSLEGPDGERVIMNHLRANRSEIKSM